MSPEPITGRVLSPDIEVLNTEPIVVCCRTCGWWNGPFSTRVFAKKWGREKHLTCESGDLQEPSDV